MVVTNQSGLARAMFDEQALELMNAHLRRELAAEGVRLDAILHCPHHVDGVVPHLAVACDCRKPEPGMLLRAARELDIDLARSWMVGDFASDVEAGLRAGCRTARVTNGHADGADVADVVAASTAEVLHAIQAAPSGGRLADGRRVHFYDDGPTRTRTVRDRRIPHTRPQPGRLRWDPLEQEWVISAPGRKARAATAEQECPLCPTRGQAATEIPVAEYDVAVVENRYPALNGAAAVPDTGGFLQDAPASGACEVISFGSDHRTPLSRLPIGRVRTVINALADRTRVLNARPGVAQVLCFENRGAQIGASLAHPHGQLYAYPFVPARLARIHECARSSHARGEGCPGCRLIEAETTARERLVVDAEHWVAFVPYACRWPYEIYVYPRRHVPDLPALKAAELDELATVYRSVIACFDSVATTPLPYMALWVQAPTRDGQKHSHLHARIFSDRHSETARKHPAAGELGAGAFVSETDPEQTARNLRSVISHKEDYVDQ